MMLREYILTEIERLNDEIAAMPDIATLLTNTAEQVYRRQQRVGELTALVKMARALDMGEAQNESDAT